MSAKHYTHITLEERIEIWHGLNCAKSARKIALELGRNPRTIQREIQRNMNKYTGKYEVMFAHDKAKQRRKHSKRKRKIDEDQQLKKIIATLISKRKWSPEQISGRLKLKKSSHQISFSTIYRYIHQGLFDRGRKHKIEFRYNLRHNGTNKRSKIPDGSGKIPRMKNISERDPVVDERGRIGDWEVDTVIGKQGEKCLVTIVDRNSRLLVGGLSNDKSSINVKNVIEQSLRDFECHTLTGDCGREFSLFSDIESILDCMFYFADPHSPWQKGTNENTNGLLREFFPKGQSLNEISKEFVCRAFGLLNSRPRKCLSYKTPFEAYKEARHLQ